MKPRKCAQCGADMPLNKENSTGIVLYKKKYYHKECFVQLCESKLENNKVRSKASWQAALDGIDELRNDATKEFAYAIAKDSLYRFVVEKYNISCVNDAFFQKLNAIYTGEYHGLVYPIGPEELLAEWQFYWDFLLSSTQFKDMTSTQMLQYHIAVLLSKNAEYRREIARKKVEEQVREAQKNVSTEIDVGAMAMMQRSVQQQEQSNKRVDLFREVMGDGD